MLRLEDYLCAYARQVPEKMAVVCGEEKLTYGDLWRKVGLLVHGMEVRKAGGGKALVIRSSQSADFLATYFAAHCANLPVVPLGKELPEERFREINPDIELTVLPEYLEAERVPELLDAQKYDFIVDAIDTIAPKCALIMEALKRKIPIVCSMGAGAKTDITQVQFADLWETYHCGLSKAVRTRLKKEGVRRKVPVVFSSEQADPNAVLRVNERNKKSTTGTISYMPAVFGCYLAQYVLTRL